MEEKNQSRLSLFIYTIVYSIAKKWRQVVSLTLVGLVFGIVISSAKLIAHQNMSYRIEGSFNVTTQTSNGNYTSNTKIPNGQDVQLSPSITSSVIYAMESKDILRESLSTAGMVKHLSSLTVLCVMMRKKGLFLPRLCLQSLRNVYPVC